MTSGGSFGAASFQQHIGLAEADRIEALEVWWPTSDTRQRFENMKADQLLEIKEFSETYDAIKRRSFHLTAKDAHHEH